MEIMKIKYEEFWDNVEKIFKHCRETRIPVVHKENNAVYGYVFKDYNMNIVELGLHRNIMKSGPGVCSEEVWKYKPCDETVFNSFKIISQHELFGLMLQNF